MTNRGALSLALSNLADAIPPLQLIEGALERLPLVVQVQLALTAVEVMIQPFGAGMAWSTLLSPGRYVIEIQDDGIGTANFVSCFPSGAGVEGASKTLVSPWKPPTNP